MTPLLQTRESVGWQNELQICTGPSELEGEECRRSRLPSETFAARRTMFLHAHNAQAVSRQANASARAGFHVDQLSCGNSFGRWSRQGREVPLGKRHLRRSRLPSETFAARRTFSRMSIMPRPFRGRLTHRQGLVSTLTSFPVATRLVAGRGRAAKCRSASGTYVVGIRFMGAGKWVSLAFRNHSGT